MKWNKILFCAAALSVIFICWPARAQNPLDHRDQKSLLEAWNQPVKPFRIIGNIYYVGTNNLACYLITTPGGIASMTDKEYWDRRARGLGGNPTTCAEENLLGYPGTRYFGENIFVHEFAHGIMGVAIRTADSALYAEIQAAYKEAMAKGLWKNHYASTNANEYWAEGTQTWFWSNYEYKDGETRVQTPEDLQRYDPKLYELLSRVYADHRIPLDVYHGKNIPPPRRRAQ
jgi:hypothetical protein